MPVLLIFPGDSGSIPRRDKARRAVKGRLGEFRSRFGSFRSRCREFGDRLREFQSQLGAVGYFRSFLRLAPGLKGGSTDVETQLNRDFRGQRLGGQIFGCWEGGSMWL
jgi:hypothetical protein